MNSLDQTLEEFASLKVDEAAVEDAQRKLEALIATRPLRSRRVTRTRGWLAAAASAAVAAVALIWLPLSPTPVLAFSAVQKQLRDFRTMRLVMEQRVNGTRTLETRVAMTRDGNVRTEVGPDIVVVVNSKEKRVLMLVKPARVAQLMPLVEKVEKSEQLEWLDEIREFQGVAKLLTQERVIDGHKVRGWQLAIQGLDMVIWATEDGVPLEMNMNQGASVQIVMHFQLDVPLAADLFSTRVPDGYKLAAEED